MADSPDRGQMGQLASLQPASQSLPEWRSQLDFRQCLAVLPLRNAVQRVFGDPREWRREMHVRLSECCSRIQSMPNTIMQSSFVTQLATLCLLITTNPPSPTETHKDSDTAFRNDALSLVLNTLQSIWSTLTEADIGYRELPAFACASLLLGWRPSARSDPSLGRERYTFNHMISDIDQYDYSVDDLSVVNMPTTNQSFESPFMRRACVSWITCSDPDLRPYDISDSLKTSLYESIWQDTMDPSYLLAAVWDSTLWSSRDVPDLHPKLSRQHWISVSKYVGSIDADRPRPDLLSSIIVLCSSPNQFRDVLGNALAIEVENDDSELQQCLARIRAFARNQMRLIARDYRQYTSTLTDSDPGPRHTQDRLWTSIAIALLTRCAFETTRVMVLPRTMQLAGQPLRDVEYRSLTLRDAQSVVESGMMFRLATATLRQHCFLGWPAGDGFSLEAYFDSQVKLHATPTLHILTSSQSSTIYTLVVTIAVPPPLNDWCFVALTCTRYDQLRKGHFSRLWREVARHVENANVGTSFKGFYTYVPTANRLPPSSAVEVVPIVERNDIDLQDADRAYLSFKSIGFSDMYMNDDHSRFMGVRIKDTASWGDRDIVGRVMYLPISGDSFPLHDQWIDQNRRDADISNAKRLEAQRVASTVAMDCKEGLEQAVVLSGSEVRVNVAGTGSNDSASLLIHDASLGVVVTALRKLSSSFTAKWAFPWLEQTYEDEKKQFESTLIELEFMRRMRTRITHSQASMSVSIDASSSAIKVVYGPPPFSTSGFDEKVRSAIADAVRAEIKTSTRATAPFPRTAFELDAMDLIEEFATTTPVILARRLWTDANLSAYKQLSVLSATADQVGSAGSLSEMARPRQTIVIRRLLSLAMRPAGMDTIDIRYAGRQSWYVCDCCSSDQRHSIQSIWDESKSSGTYRIPAIRWVKDLVGSISHTATVSLNPPTLDALRMSWWQIMKQLLTIPHLRQLTHVMARNLDFISAKAAEHSRHVWNTKSARERVVIDDGRPYAFTSVRIRPGGEEKEDAIPTPPRIVVLGADAVASRRDEIMSLLIESNSCEDSTFAVHRMLHNKTPTMGLAVLPASGQTLLAVVLLSVNHSSPIAVTIKAAVAQRKWRARIWPALVELMPGVIATLTQAVELSATLSNDVCDEVAMCSMITQWRPIFGDNSLTVHWSDSYISQCQHKAALVHPWPGLQAQNGDGETFVRPDTTEPSLWTVARLVRSNRNRQGGIASQSPRVVTTASINAAVIVDLTLPETAALRQQLGSWSYNDYDSVVLVHQLIASLFPVVDFIRIDDFVFTHDEDKRESRTRPPLVSVRRLGPQKITWPVPVGSVSMRGGRTYQEDRASILRNTYPLFSAAVADGHGVNAASIAETVCKELPILILASIERDPSGGSIAEIVHTFDDSRLAEELDGGTTFVQFVVNAITGKGLIVNVGDSGGMVFHSDPSHATQIVVSTVFHKPDYPDERARIERAGGTVDKPTIDDVYRVGDLALSRSMGDRALKTTGQDAQTQRAWGGRVVATPDIVQFDVNRHDMWAVLATDGIFDYWTYENIARMIVAEFEKSGSVSAVTQRLSAAWEQERITRKDKDCDNATLIVIKLT